MKSSFIIGRPTWSVPDRFLWNGNELVHGLDCQG
jgi:hypothetical protein